MENNNQALFGNYSPSDMMVKFYAQRAGNGNLLIMEGTSIAITGRSYYGAPGIYDDNQVPAWQKLTGAVHANGGLIFLQLFHGGRQSHTGMTGGAAPVGPSALPFEGKAVIKEGWVTTSPNRALETREIPWIIDEYRWAAERALEAGFDGVELHGANGYLPDRFLQDGTNHRTDEYGGPIEDRAKLMLEIIQTLIAVWGAGRAGVRISPSGEWGAVSDIRMPHLGGTEVLKTIPGLPSVHRSFIVGLQQIDSYTARAISIAGQEIPIGDSYGRILDKLK